MSTYCCETKALYDVCVCPNDEVLQAVMKNVFFEYIKDPIQANPTADDLHELVKDIYEPYESMYELTLTTDVDEPYDLRMALDRIVRSAMFDIKGFIAVIELTKAGLPHIHALLFSRRKYIEAAKIKTIYAKRYECKRVRKPKCYYDYIMKERDNPLVVDYCARKGIPQIWESGSFQDI